MGSFVNTTGGFTWLIMMTRKLKQENLCKLSGGRTVSVQSRVQWNCGDV